MSKYTPDTEEVRIKYRLASGNGVETPSEFDRWLAEVRATALEEAADEMEGGFNADTFNLERRQIKRWLRVRAARIREEGQA